MESPKRARHDEASMRIETARKRSWVTPAVLLLMMAVVAGAYIIAPRAVETTRGLSGALVAVPCLVATVVIARRPRAGEHWRSARLLAYGTLAIGLVAGLFAVRDVGGGAGIIPSGYEVAFVLVALVFLAPIVVEFADHLTREDRREISADVALITVALGTILYLGLRPDDPDASVSI